MKSKKEEMMRVEPDIKVTIWVEKNRRGCKTMNEALKEMINELNKLKRERRDIRRNI